METKIDACRFSRKRRYDEIWIGVTSCWRDSRVTESSTRWIWMTIRPPPPPPKREGPICGTLSCHTGHGITRAPDDNPLSVHTDDCGQSSRLQDLITALHTRFVIRTRSSRVEAMNLRRIFLANRMLALVGKERWGQGIGHEWNSRWWGERRRRGDLELDGNTVTEEIWLL